MPPAAVQAAVGGSLAYTTVMTILVRLHDKRLIERTKTGRAFAYRPVVAETEVVAEQVRHLLAHGNNRAAVLQGFIDGLRPEDETMLRAMLAGLDAASPSGTDPAPRAGIDSAPRAGIDSASWAGTDPES